jgi:hypothetical protein
MWKQAQERDLINKLKTDMDRMQIALRIIQETVINIESMLKTKPPKK